MIRNPKVEQWIDGLSPAFIEIALAIQELLHTEFPDMTESYKWNMPVYESNGIVGYIAAFKDHLNLGFYKGIYLNDPNNRLEGSGEELRHCKIRSMEEVDLPQFKAWFQQAISLQQK